MEALFDSLLQLLVALWQVFYALLGILLPWTPLAVWVGFWLFAVNWTKLYPLLWQRWGGWVALLLIGVVMILVWGTLAPPEGGVHRMLGLELSNYVGKTVYVTALFCIMFLCGSVQLSGCCARCCRFDDEPESESAHAAH